MKLRVTDSPAGSRTLIIRPVAASPKSVRAAVSQDVGDMALLDQSGGRNRSAPMLLVSLGPAKDCNEEILRRAGGSAVKWLITHNVRRAAVEALHLKSLGLEEGLTAFCEGLMLGAFQFERYKTVGKPQVSLTVDVVVKGAQTRLRKALRRTQSVAEAVNLARDWAHEPPNVINPVSLAMRIKKMAQSAKLKCTIFDEKRLAQMGAGAILAVGTASKSQPRLIVLEYAGRDGRRNVKPVVLVGKAITFDTGGYSLKDKDAIVGMKYDKCGGMAVVGAMKAVAALKPGTPVVGIIAAAENMISGQAYRPNDIVRTMSGKTVEIISTDAEGRMVLADALTYAQKHYDPRSIIDLATLTGGVVVALGSVRAGLMSNDDRLAEALQAAGERVHERLWRLPQDDDYLELIKGDDSDLKNSGGREAHPVIGGFFLKQFVNANVPWAHLDIAGTATTDKDLPYCPRGATGFGIRLLMDYIERL